MNINTNEPFKSRSFCAILYPEDLSHVNALSKIKEIFDYAYILHDKDTVEEEYEDEYGIHHVGQLKKKHWHIFFSTPTGNGWSSKSVAKQLGIEHNYIEKPRHGIDNCLLYLIHFNDLDKYQYSLNDVVTNVYLGRIKDLIASAPAKDMSEAEALRHISEHIESLNTFKERTYLINYCASHGLGKFYRMYHYVLDDAFKKRMRFLKYIRESGRHLDNTSEYVKNIDNPDSDSFVDDDGFSSIIDAPELFERCPYDL